MRKSVPLLLLAALVSCQKPVPEAPARIDDGRVTSADGVSIAYSLEGTGEPPLVFVHGWNGNRGYWSDQIADFSAEHAVVTVDLAGHGDSGANRDAWSFAAFGEDIRAVVEELDLRRVVLIGHSMGGPAALEAARLMPQRVVGVIGVDTFHDAERRGDFESIIGQLESDFPGTCARIVRSMFAEGSDPDLVDRILGEMCACDPEVSVATFRLFPDYDMAAALQAVSVPVRSINASQLPTHIEINRKYADFDARIMSDVGHFLMMEQPDEFNRILADLLPKPGNGILDSP